MAEEKKPETEMRFGVTGFINPDWAPAYRDNSQTEDVLLCTKCNAPYFEQIRVSKFVKTHYVLVGQAVPIASIIAFVLLRCVKCGQLHEPNLQLPPNDRSTIAYNDLVAILSGEPNKAIK